ncbi:MAG: magnesium chelatase, partial [Lachnospiraceae bacterium]|nr:magnesium chelatase [Lachnospiraceae bacterium]
SSQVFVHDILLEYIADIVQATRENKNILSGVSPRGTIAFVHAAQAFAWIQGRDYVVPEDIKRLAVPMLAHRLVLSRGYGSTRTGEAEIQNILDQVSVPTEDWERR